MPAPAWSAERSRKIAARVVLEGDLMLLTPAHFGSGDGDDLTDMPLLTDPLDEQTPLLTGASLAGALRSALREREHGYGGVATRESASVRLFGGLQADDDGEQSPLIVEDARATTFGVERRHGVAILPETRTAEDDKLFDLELWEAGTTFPVRFELVVRDPASGTWVQEAEALKRALATALEGLQNDSITLGARKRRGYGRVGVTNWRARTYDLSNVADLRAWLTCGAQRLSGPAVTTGETAAQALGLVSAAAGAAASAAAGAVGDRRALFHIEATLALDGSLLIRAGGADDAGPDMVHLRSRRARRGDPVPVLSGTTLAGALRARARRIIHTLAPALAAAEVEQELAALFGAIDRAARLSVAEGVVEGGRADLVQHRVSIDRFTGGAYETALFNEQPVFGGASSRVNIDLRLAAPQDHEIGLLLLLLKDLWTGDLPLGGESGAGRGRLAGRQATLMLRRDGAAETWTLTARRDGLALGVTGGHDTLQRFISALGVHLAGRRR